MEAKSKMSAVMNKSLLDLGAWHWDNEPSAIELSSDRLTVELDTLSKKALHDFSINDIYLTVSQCKGLPYTLPLAIKLLNDDLLIECVFYPGDLLKAVLQVPSAYFQQHTDDFIKVAGLVSLKVNKRIMSSYDGNRELRRLFESWSDYRETYWLRVITNSYHQPIDDIKEFIYRVVGDDQSSDVDFSDYIKYWKTDYQGVLSVMISTIIPFDILRERISDKWCAADKMGNAFVVDSRTGHINCSNIFWMSIDRDENR